MDQNITWFPGHMAKARRKIVAGLKLVDGVLEVIDSRAPISTRNPDFAELFSDMPRLIVATKKDLADPKMTQLWLEYWKSKKQRCVIVNLNSSSCLNLILRELKGMKKSSKFVDQRFLIAGIPNTGKSTLINRLAKKKKTTTGALAGVTRSDQWIKIAEGIYLLDTPGILPPKLADAQTGYLLAWLGGISVNAYDSEFVGFKLLEYLARVYPHNIESRFQIKIEEYPSTEEILKNIALRRGMVLKGGIIDTKRCLEVLLKEFRSGLLGRITLEAPQ